MSLKNHSPILDLAWAIAAQETVAWLVVAVQGCGRSWNAICMSSESDQNQLWSLCLFQCLQVLLFGGQSFAFFVNACFEKVSPCFGMHAPFVHIYLKGYALCRRPLVAPRIAIEGARCLHFRCLHFDILGNHFSTSGAPCGAILAPWGHPGGPWEQQDRLEMVVYKI